MSSRNEMRGIMTEADVIDGLYKHFALDICFDRIKDGPSIGQYRQMDFVAIQKTWSPPTIKIIEVKCSRSDFLADNKWGEYFKLANKFYFACPKGLIQKGELDPRVGLIYVGENDEGEKTTRAMKAAIYQPKDLDAGLLLYLILWRLGDIDKPNLIERIKREMAENKQIGDAYAHFVSERLCRAMNDLNEEREKIEHGNSRNRAVIEWFEQHPKFGDYDIRHILDNADTLKDYAGLKENFEEAARIINEINKALK